MKGALRAYVLLREVRDRVWSLLLAPAFASFGTRSRVSMPIQVHGAKRITIGAGVYFGPGCWLLTHEPAGRLTVGEGTSIAGYCVLSAALEIEIGRKVLFARNVYVADHRHGFEQRDVPVLDQHLTDLRPVRVEDGAWLGQNVVILPGVTVGRGAIVGANSVVREDVPPRCVAAGAPARVVRRLA